MTSVYFFSSRFLYIFLQFCNIEIAILPNFFVNTVYGSEKGN